MDYSIVLREGDHPKKKKKKISIPQTIYSINLKLIKDIKP